MKDKIFEGILEKRKRVHIAMEYTPDLSDYEWFVRWDEPERGLHNLSLPLHPDDDYFGVFKEGNKVKFRKSYYGDIHESWDVAALKEPSEYQQ